MALLTKLKMPIIALPPVALALLVLLGALGVRPNEVSGAAQIWVGRVAELEQDGLPPSFVAARGDEPLPVLITSGTAQAVTAGSRLEISWPASQAEAGRLVVAFDAAQERLYLLDPLTGELYTANPGSQTIQTAGVIAAAVGSRALAVDGAGNRLYLLDAAGTRVFSLPLSATGTAPATPVADLTSLGLAPAGALALHPEDGRLYLLSLRGSSLYQLSTAGELQDSFAIPPASPSRVRAMTFAPSHDTTDAPETQSLYIVGETATYEWWPQNAPNLVAETLVADLVQSTDTSLYDIPSPDPAGLAYWPGVDRLVATDSEVNETDIFDGRSAFVVTRTGTATHGSDLTPVTDEPTGVAMNIPAGTLFYSDDTGTRTVYEVNKMPNEVVSAGNVVGVYPIGGDPEGVAFDAAGRRLFIIDGQNRDLHVVTRTDSGGGPFLAAGASHVLSTFDLGIHNLVDPEGVEYDPDTGLIYVLDSAAPYLIYEFELDGDLTLLNTIDISAAGPDKPAGLAIAPSSNGGAGRNFYIVDRGEDSGSNVTNNDGRLYELCVGACANMPDTTPETPAPTDTPETPTATATITPTETLIPTATTAAATPTAQSTAEPTATEPSPRTPTPTGTLVTPTATATATATRTPGPDDVQFFFSIMAVSRGGFGEENDDCSEAHPVRLNNPLEFLPEDGVDWYRFSTPTAGHLVVRVTGFVPVEGQVAVYRGESCEQAQFLKNMGTIGSTKTVDLGNQPAGNYFVFVSNDGPLMNQPYQLTIEFTASN